MINFLGRILGKRGSGMEEGIEGCIHFCQIIVCVYFHYYTHLWESLFNGFKQQQQQQHQRKELPNKSTSFMRRHLIA